MPERELPLVYPQPIALHRNQARDSKLQTFDNFMAICMCFIFIAYLITLIAENHATNIGPRGPEFIGIWANNKYNKNIDLRSYEA